MLAKYSETECIILMYMICLISGKNLKVTKSSPVFSLKSRPLHLMERLSRSLYVHMHTYTLHMFTSFFASPDSRRRVFLAFQANDLTLWLLSSSWDRSQNERKSLKIQLPVISDSSLFRPSASLPLHPLRLRIQLWLWILDLFVVCQYKGPKVLSSHSTSTHLPPKYWHLSPTGRCTGHMVPYVGPFLLDLSSP